MKSEGRSEGASDEAFIGCALIFFSFLVSCPRSPKNIFGQFYPVLASFTPPSSVLGRCGLNISEPRNYRQRLAKQHTFLALMSNWFASVPFKGGTGFALRRGTGFPASQCISIQRLSPGGKATISSNVFKHILIKSHSSSATLLATMSCDHGLQVDMEWRPGNCRDSA
jgi:hypothetical protein